jgi:hypothetical protein
VSRLVRCPGFHHAGCESVSDFIGSLPRWRQQCLLIGVYCTVAEFGRTAVGIRIDYAVPPASYGPLNEEGLRMQRQHHRVSRLHLNPVCWASMAILQRLLYLSDVPSLYRGVRDLCQVFAVVSRSSVALGPPPVTCTTCSSTGLERSTRSTPRVCKSRQTHASLFRSFFRPNAHHRVQNGPAALRRLYAISQYCHGLVSGVAQYGVGCLKVGLRRCAHYQRARLPAPTRSGISL